MNRKSSILGLLAALPILLFATVSQATEAGWALMREGGQAVLIRHAAAPGSTDSAAFSLDDCATQRNLSDRGRQQAKRIGALIAARAARTQQVFSSRSCRCLETATIAFQDMEVEPLDALDPPPSDPAAAKAAGDAVRALVSGYSGAGNLILVTHGETIQALAGITPREGEAVIVRTEGDHLRVLGRIVF